MTPARPPGAGGPPSRPPSPRSEPEPAAAAAPAADPARASDLQMGAYLLAREAMGRRVPTPTRELLLRTHESRKEVLQLMPYGRANVGQDLRITGKEGFYRLLAQRRTIGDLSTLGASPLATRAREAAITACAGAGNCGEFANVAAHVHAARMREGESVEIQRAGTGDHSWAVVQGSAEGAAPAPCAVIDAWGEGPAADAADNRFTAGATAEPRTEHVIGSDDAAEAGRVFRAGLAEPDRKTLRRMDLLVQANRRQGREPTGTVYAPTPALRPDFCRAARDAIEQHDAPEQLHSRAAALARELAGVPAGEEAGAADTIIEMAANLDRPLERPLAALPAQPRDDEPA